MLILYGSDEVLAEKENEETGKSTAYMNRLIIMVKRQ